MLLYKNVVPLQLYLNREKIGMITQKETRSSVEGHILRRLLRREGFNENISQVGLRSEIVHVFGMQPDFFTKKLKEAIDASSYDVRVRFFAHSLNITGDAKGSTLEERRQKSGFRGSPSTWVRHEMVAAEILSNYLLLYRPEQSELPLVLATGYNPLEREVAHHKAEKLKLQGRIKELEAQLDRIHQLSSRV